MRVADGVTSEVERFVKQFPRGVRVAGFEFQPGKVRFQLSNPQMFGSEDSDQRRFDLCEEFVCGIEVAGQVLTRREIVPA